MTLQNTKSGILKAFFFEVTSVRRQYLVVGD